MGEWGCMHLLLLNQLLFGMEKANQRRGENGLIRRQIRASPSTKDELLGRLN